MSTKSVQVKENENNFSFLWSSNVGQIFQLWTKKVSVISWPQSEGQHPMLPEAEEVANSNTFRGVVTVSSFGVIFRYIYHIYDNGFSIS